MKFKLNTLIATSMIGFMISLLVGCTPKTTIIKTVDANNIARSTVPYIITKPVPLDLSSAKNVQWKYDLASQSIVLTLDDAIAVQDSLFLMKNRIDALYLIIDAYEEHSYDVVGQAVHSEDIKSTEQIQKTD